MTNSSIPPKIEKFAPESVPVWMEWSGFSLADVLNEDDTPIMKLGAVGFLRAPAGATSTFKFAYDEVLIVLKGRCSVKSGDETLAVRPGELVYLPANTPGSFVADEHIEVVYVASPPYGEVNREARAALLAAGRTKEQANV